MREEDDCMRMSLGESQRNVAAAVRSKTVRQHMRCSQTLPQRSYTCSPKCICNVLAGTTQCQVNLTIVRQPRD